MAMIEKEEDNTRETKKKYRAYHTSPECNSRLGIFDYCDLYELEALHVPISMDKVQFYQDNPNEPILTKNGNDGHIIKLNREQSYYHSQVSASAVNKRNYIVVPTLLRVRRFQKVSAFDLEQWEVESNNEPDVIFVGQLAGIAVVREILQTTGEEAHPVVSSRDKQFQALLANSPDGLIEVSDPYQAYDYESIFEIVSPCGYWDCPLCYGELRVFPKKRLFLLGEPVDSLALVKEAKRRKLIGMLRLTNYLKMLQMLDAINYYSQYDVLAQMQEQQENNQGKEKEEGNA